MSNIRELIRIALVTKVESLKATFSSYPLVIEYANGNVVNTALQKNPYLRVWIVYQDGQQVDLSNKPGHRLMGTLVVEACVKAGTGTSAANKLLGHFYPELQMKDTIKPLRTLAARFASKEAGSDGWATEAALIPFWADSIRS